MKPIKFQPTQTDYYPIKGGLDLVTPPIAVDPGRCFDAQNYEPDAVGGNRRINGFERFDGRISPTSASYWIIRATITGAIAVDSTLTGLTSAATGKVLLVDGSTIILGRVAGAFQLDESLQVTGVTQATSTSLATENGASMPSDNNDYKLLAANDRRADITVVPGSGSPRGGFTFGDVTYAFRDNVGATAGLMYKQTAAGWVQVTFGNELQFTGATGQIFAGNTITGGTSGATATVVRALLRTGTWTSAGAGTLILSGLVGAFVNGENIRVGGVTKAVANGASTAITRAPGGRIEFVIANFTGSTSTKRVYGCDGVNLAFEFDGTNYIPIRTGMDTDTPKHIAYHVNRLFLTFIGSLQLSAVGDPYSWSVVTGAAEIAMGDEITSIVPQSGNANGTALAVNTEGRTSILYGSSSATFNLVPSVYDLGYKAYTVQPVGNNTYGLTARGVQSLVTTLSYGDFQFAALSFFIQPLLAQKAGLETASTSLRTKNQYRLYFSDGSGIVFGLTGDKISGILPLNYGLPVLTMWTSTLSTGEEVTYFTSNDGYVYQDSVGTSFDGDPIEAWCRPVFNNLRSPRVRKQFRRAIFEVKCDGYCEVNATYDLGYATSNVSQASIQQDQQLLGAGGYWGQFTWDEFTWDAPVVADAQISIDGIETNIGFLFYSNRAQDDSHTLSGINLLYTPRRVVHSGT